MKLILPFRLLAVLILLLLSVNVSSAQWIKQQVLNPLDSGFSFYPGAVQFTDANTGYLAGTDYSFGWYPGQIFKTTNGGNNWTQQSVNIAYKIWDIEPVNSLIVFAACDSSQVIRTLTGGSIWSLLNTPAVPSVLVRWRISFINALTGWISSSDQDFNKTYQTTNGGQNWTAVNSAYGFSKIKFVSSANGFGMNKSGFFVSTNSGANWANTMPDSLLAEFYFKNASTGWLFSKKSSYVSTIKGKSWKTTNGGVSWTLLYANDTSGKAPSGVVFFDDFLTGYANYYVDKKYQSGIIKTTDGGLNWFNPTDYRLLRNDRRAPFSFFLNQSTGWYGTEYDYLYKTSTGAGNLVNPFFADNYKFQNSNNLNNYISGYGSLTEAVRISDFSSGPGFEYPKGSGKYIVFNSGLVIGAKVGGETRVSSAYSGASFTPGIFDGAGNETGSRLGEYGMFQIKTGDGAGVPDWDHWPAAQGAPFVSGNPQLTGQQTTFVSFTDGANGSIGGAPLKAEVKMTSYTFNDDLRKDAIYYKLNITNKNSQNWDSVYFSFFIDADIGTSSDDRMGCDTALNLIYAYNGTSDAVYGNAPPAAGYKLISSTPGLRLSSCVPFYNTSSAPSDPCMTDAYDKEGNYNFQKGFTKCGTPYTFNGNEVKFVYTGDPETSTGWNCSFSGDVRLAMNFGPIALPSGQSAAITLAAIVAKGSSGKNSVTKLKQYAAILPVGIQEASPVIPAEYKLRQNFPNPFNPVTKISYSVPKTSFVELNVFDISGKLVQTLVSQNLQTGNYEAEFNGEKLSSGVYICRLNAAGYSNSIKMLLVK
ncbi:MAG: T9SS type A sorting domain-containing protein [Ignavibacteria bacterium]|nr:T9SS type A sorting domain-containing protein [Ignavibacteria bacterium]